MTSKGWPSHGPVRLSSSPRNVPGVGSAIFTIKNALRHILGPVSVADDPPCRRIDKVHMPAHQFGKRRFGSAFAISAQKLLVALAGHSQDSNRRAPNRTKKRWPFQRRIGRESRPGTAATGAPAVPARRPLIAPHRHGVSRTSGGLLVAHWQGSLRIFSLLAPRRSGKSLATHPFLLMS